MSFLNSKKICGQKNCIKLAKDGPKPVWKKVMGTFSLKIILFTLRSILITVETQGYLIDFDEL